MPATGKTAQEKRSWQKVNPKGIQAQSPGLRAASYPGKRHPSAVNPTGQTLAETLKLLESSGTAEGWSLDIVPAQQSQRD
jgi:hypothetical protein